MKRARAPGCIHKTINGDLLRGIPPSRRRLPIPSLRLRRLLSSGRLFGSTLSLLGQLRVVPVDRFASRRAQLLTGQQLKGLPLRLRDQQAGEASAEHEQSEDLHDVVEPWRVGRTLGGAPVHQRAKHALGDDGSNLSSSGADAMGGGTVARWEALSRHDERGGVGTEVEEELRDDVERQEAIVGILQRVIGETDDDEEDGQHDEAHQLDRLTAEGINRSDGNPVSGDGTGADQNQVADGGPVEVFVDVFPSSPSDSRQDDAVVQSKAVERW
mgnify:CR=1 FL=1